MNRKRIIGCTSLILCFILILAGSFTYLLLLTYPELLSKLGKFANYFSYISIGIGALGVTISVVSNLMGDIIGISLRDIIVKEKSNLHAHNYEHYFPFQVVRDHDSLYKILFPEPSLIPERSIPYQNRCKDQKTSEILREKLLTSKAVFISGVAGSGKTKEVTILLTQLIDEGYSVLIANRNINFTIPIDFPNELHNRLVFVFDDFHQFSTRSQIIINNSSTVSGFLRNFVSFLESTKRIYTKRDVYTICIARKDGDTLKNISYPADPIWKTFASYELPPPDNDAQTKLLEELATILQVTVIDTQTIASHNDKTFRNIVQNIFRISRSDGILNLANFKPRQGLSWSFRYQELTHLYGMPVIALFDTLCIFSKMNVLPNNRLILAVTRYVLYKSMGMHVFSWDRIHYHRRLQALIDSLCAAGDITIDDSGTLILHESLLLEHKPQKHIELPGKVLWKNIRKYADLDSCIYFAQYSLTAGRNFLFCISVCTEILRKAPREIWVLQVRAAALIGLEYFDLALEDITTAHTIRPDEPKFLVWKGLINQRLGKINIAEQHYREAAKKSCDDLSLFTNLAELYVSKGDLFSACSNISKAIKLAPERSDFFVQRAYIYRRMHQNYLATKDIEQALEKDNSDKLEILLYRIHLYIEDKLFDLAKEEINRVSSNYGENPKLHYLRGLLHTKNKHYKEAEYSYNKAIELNPNNALYYFLRSEIKIKTHDYYESLEDFIKSVKLANRAAKKTTKFEISNESSEDIDSRYLLLSSDFSDRYRMFTVRYDHFGLSVALPDKHDLFEIFNYKARLSSIIKRTPSEIIHLASNDFEFLEECAVQYADKGQIQNAIKVLDYCISNSPSSHFYHQRAHLHEKQMHNKKAIQDFDEAIKLDPEDISNYLCQNKILKKTNKKKAIRNNLVTAENLLPGDVGVKMYLIDSITGKTQLEKLKSKYLQDLVTTEEAPVTLMALSYLCLKLDNAGESFRFLQQTINCNINNDSIIANLLDLILYLRPHLSYLDKAKLIIFTIQLISKTPDNTYLKATRRHLKHFHYNYIYHFLFEPKISIYNRIQLYLINFESYMRYKYKIPVRMAKIRKRMLQIN